MSETRVMADQSRRSSGWGSIVVGTLFGGFGTVFIVGVSIATMADPFPTSFFPLFLMIIPGIFAVGGGIAVISGIRKVRLSHLLGVPTLILPRGEPLYLGSVVVAGFHRSGGARRAQRSPRLSAHLVGEEKVTYRQGTDDHTVTHEIHRHELATKNDQIPDRVSGQVTIKVPVDVPPTLALRHNRIVWSVQVRVRVPGVPDDTGTFGIEILPAVATRRIEDR